MDSFSFGRCFEWAETVADALDVMYLDLDLDSGSDCCVPRVMSMLDCTIGCSLASCRVVLQCAMRLDVHMVVWYNIQTLTVILW